MSTYDDASLIYYPSGYKAGTAYSLKPTDGSGDLTFTRASTATRVNEQGLIEGARTNLQIYSEDFRNIAEGGATNTWTPNDTIILSTNNTAPDGTLTATRIRGISGGNKARQAIIIGTSGAPYSGSIYIRRVSGTGTIQLRVGDVGTTSTINPTSTWQRFDHTVSPTTTTIRLALVLSNDTDEFEIWGAQLEQSASPTEYIPTTTTAVSVGMLANVPRIDFTGAGCAKLLLEPQRTNLVRYSEDLNSWLKLDTSVTVNTTTSPNGTTNADTVTATGAGSLSHLIYQNLAFTSGTAYSYSVFAKANTSNYIQLVFAGNLIANSYANFDLSSGTITASAFVTAKIENYGNGWYRCSISATAGASSTNSQIVYLINSPTASRGQSFVQSGESVYLWGGSFENGSYATSYIPTTSTAATRVSDSASKSGISSLINSTEGVLYAEISALALTNSLEILSLSDGTYNNVVLFRYYDLSDNQIQVQLRRLGVIEASILFTLTNAKDFNKIAFKYKENDFALWVNGVNVGTDISGSTFAANTLSKFAFDRGDGSNPMVANVQNLMVFPSALSDTELAALTTL